jgi:two-component system NarL family sensor kinase
MTSATTVVGARAGTGGDAVLRRVAVLGGGISVLCGITALLLHVVYAAVWPADLDPYWRSAVVWSIAMGGPGAALAWLRPANAVGWLVMSAGLAGGLGEVVFAWSVVALEVAPSALGFHPLLVWVGSWLWVPGYLLVPTLVLLLVPEGRPPSPRWTPVLWFQIAVMALATTGFALTPWDAVEPPTTWQGLTNPLGVPGAERLLHIALPLVGVSVLASVTSLVVRVRRAEGAERQQLKWVLLGAVLTVLLGASAFLAPAASAPWVAAAVLLPLVAGAAVAALRYRLWDVEALIARSAIYVALSLLVAATYLLVVGLIGVRVGDGTAPLMALVLVALGLQPARTAVQRQVNRLLYGQRDDPYGVLATLGHRLEGAAAAEPGGEALPDVARTVAEALRLPYAGVVVDGDLVSSHGYRPSVVERLPLVHRGEQVGALEVAARRGEAAIGAQDRQLLGDLARSLAGAAHSLRLTRALVDSRLSLVTAREEERRRLHRDIHDDLGSALAALALQLEAAQDQVSIDPAQAQVTLARVTRHVREAVATTRRIVTDLRPANLDDLGLVGALEELAARFTSGDLIVDTRLQDPGELPAAVEVVLYRVAAEALTNVIRHSGASTCRISLHRDGTDLRLAVRDDGTGGPATTAAGVGLRSMRDRTDEVGGTCTVEHELPGTHVSVVVPLGAS